MFANMNLKSSRQRQNIHKNQYEIESAIMQNKIKKVNTNR